MSSLIRYEDTSTLERLDVLFSWLKEYLLDFLLKKKSRDFLLTSIIALITPKSNAPHFLFAQIPAYFTQDWSWCSCHLTSADILKDFASYEKNCLPKGSLDISNSNVVPVQCAAVNSHGCVHISNYLRYRVLFYVFYTFVVRTLILCELMNLNKSSFLCYMFKWTKSTETVLPWKYSLPNQQFYFHV